MSFGTSARALLAILWAASACVGFAQDAASSDAPELKVGDRWKYRVIDLWTDRELRTVEHSVKNLADGAYEFESRRSDKPAPNFFKTNLQLNVLIKGRDVADNGYFQFPLSVGTKWKAKTYSNNGTDGKGKTGIPYVTVHDREVVSRESVTVPAGSFDTFKIVTKSLSTGDFGAWTSFREESTVWFAPSARRFVKLEEFGWNTLGTPEYRTRLELVEYQISK